MTITVHHRPLSTSLLWALRAWELAWDGNAIWDRPGIVRGNGVDFQFPDVDDPRELSFKYRSTSGATGQTVWEPDDFVRQLVQTTTAEVWTFVQSARILCEDPAPAGINFKAGDVVTFHAITRQKFRGGQLYIWDPYNSTSPIATYPESGRDDDAGVSTFSVSLADWMIGGFHLKLVGFDDHGAKVWEPDASNRVWQPCDGNSCWLKSGQCDVRSAPLSLTTLTLEVFMPASLVNAPTLALTDNAEGSAINCDATVTQVYAGSSLFKIATYQPAIYPQAGYTLSATVMESSPIARPFPANPADLTETSRFALGAGAWLKTFPAVSQSVTLVVEPKPVSSFRAGLFVQPAIGNSAPYQTVAATKNADGGWTAELSVAANITTNLRLVPVSGDEPKPYDWIDTSRYFTPSGSAATYYTAEGLFGLALSGKTQFSDLTNRTALMQSAFGFPIVSSGVFQSREAPHGATISGGSVYFVLHAPHAVVASLVLVAPAAGAATRELIPMTLTFDTFYWWCSVPLSKAPAGTRYHFILNDTLEIIDPAAREVQDNGSFDVTLGADPNDATTSWAIILDVEPVRAIAHAQPWQTMGWQNLLIYELHARRFTDRQPGNLAALDLLVDELKPISRLGQAGYLQALPITAIELLPVQEFNNTISWGYDPSFYFAIDGHYGGSMALARFVNAAHRTGRAVLLDVVYNHSLGSPLMKVAPDVYRNGDYDGDRMNCGHPMVVELLRQATIHIWRTFGLDGFRFDDTNTIVTKCQGGWEFLSTIRWALRTAATAEGLNWPYCVAENSATSPWDISNPGFGVMDGQWGIDEVYKIRAASYDSAHPGWDDSQPLKAEMDNPAYFGRPFFQATRFGESHDMVSAQDSANLRIAARPPFGQGWQLAKALGTLTLLSNGVPMLFMGQEAGETSSFSFDSNAPALNPQRYDLPPNAATDNTRVLAWFRQLMGLRNDPAQGLQGNSNYQVVATGNRTIAMSCGSSQSLFVVVTFGTPDQRQDSGWLGLPTGNSYKEIFNSSWPAFAVEFEPEISNGGYSARINSGQVLNLPFMGAVVLQRT